MKAMRSIQGVIPVLVTPFTESEAIDEAGLERLVRFLTGKKIGGLWVLGTGSEDMNLTFEKRLTVARIVTEINAGKVPIILGAGFFAMEDIMRFIRETAALDFDAYHIMPYHPLLGLDRLDWFYRQIADAASKPVWMYTSANWSRPVNPEFIKKLKSHPNVAGIKYSNRNAVDMFKVIGLIEDGFQVITAVASQLYPCLLMGSPAHTSSLGSALPEILIRIYTAFKEGNHELAVREQTKLNQFLEALPQRLRNDNFLQAAEEKFILSVRNICSEYTSSYYSEINTEEKKIIKHALKKFDFYDA